jgi:membrane AbrB-like protein
VFAALWMIITGLLLGKFLAWLGIQEDTAFFSAMPGGITELTFIAMSFDADPFQVALFHATRMISLLVVFPFIIRRQKREGQPAVGRPEDPRPDSKRSAKRLDWAIVFLLAFVAGYALDRLKVPVGAFIGPLVTTGIYAVRQRVSLRMNQKVRDVIETCVGGAVGTRVTVESLRLVPSLLLPVALLDFSIILSSVMLAKVLYKTSGMDRVTCCLAAVPGGFSPFVVLARQMNANVSYVATFHLCRYLSMILFALLLGFWGNFG